MEKAPLPNGKPSGSGAFARSALVGARRVVGIDGHGLEAFFHEFVVVVPGAELLDGVMRRLACFALVPGVEGEQGKGSVDDR